MKKTTIQKIITSFFVVLFFFICLFVFKNIHSEADHSTSLGTIGIYPITSDEILMYANKNKTAVGEKFAKENNIDSYGSSFWTNNYRGKTPIDPLSAAIQSDLIYASTLHSEAKSYGIDVTDDFTSIKSNWEAIKKKEGTTLSLYDYINNQLSNESDELKEKLYEENPPTETELQEAFDSLGDAYKREDFKLSGIEVKFPADQLEAINNSLNELSTQHNDDYIVEQLGTLYPNSVFKIFSINSQETQKEDLYTLSTSEILFDKNTNELIEGSLEEQWFYITNKEGGNILSYKDAPNLGKNKYINDLFSQHMSEATNKNNVDLSQSITKVLMNNKEDIF